jgi:Kef-type K+ transport system membrane component KefB
MLVKVLLALTVIMITARVVGLLFARLNQPAVIGEVVGGIILGPSLLGRLSPEAAAFLLPADAAPFLGVIAQIGVILYMFLIGLELDLGVLRARWSMTIVISQASIVVPFALGGALALVLFESLAPAGVPFSSFLLFIGVSMSITAFPVLARILGDRGLQKTPMGILALTCAAINDAIAWCLLAFVVGVMQATPVAAIRTVALTFLYIALMLTVGRAIVVRAVARLDRSARIGEQTLALVLVGVLLSAVATEVSAQAHQRLADIVRVMFLPAFFAFTGLRTEIGLLDGVQDWLLCGVIIVVATVGKFGGTTLAAKVMGLDWRDSAALGILMNTRGLVELIVLNIGLDLGVITPRLFTMLVIMALVTTMMTSPVLMALLRKHPWTEAATLHRESA